MALSLVLFGSMSASLEEPTKTHPLVMTPRIAELLAFLALRRGQYFHRTDIAESIWEHCADDGKLGRLNTALWRLRRTIEQTPRNRGDFLQTNRQGSVGLSGPQPVSVDVGEFELLAREGLRRPMDALGHAELTSLQTAVALYHDNLLADFTGTWVLKERERIRNLFLDAAGRLMQVSARQGQYEEAIHYARSVLAVDVLREDVHRNLIRYLAASGQRASALRQFEACREALLRDLAIQPMAETLALYREITNAAVSRSVSPGPSVPVIKPLREPVGRPVKSTTNGQSRTPPQMPLAAVDQVTLARSLIADVDAHLQQTIDLLQH
jgi:DNA-binding SARP family transcriptional activator